MKRTYTEHKLTDPMLRRLNKLKNGRGAAGVSMDALRRRGLVYDANAHCVDKYGIRTEYYDWRITVSGVDALQKARLEGW